MENNKLQDNLEDFLKNYDWKGFAEAFHKADIDWHSEEWRSFINAIRQEALLSKSQELLERVLKIQKHYGIAGEQADTRFMNDEETPEDGEIIIVCNAVDKVLDDVSSIIKEVMHVNKLEEKKGQRVCKRCGVLEWSAEESGLLCADNERQMIIPHLWSEEKKS